MSSATHPVPGRTSSPSPVRSAAARILGALSSFAGFLDRHPSACIIVLLASTLPYSIARAFFMRLTADEVYTARIAAQPSIADLISVSRQVDLHPPLHYLLERAALHLPLTFLVAARLPSLLAFAFSLCLLFAFTRRRLGVLAGLAAASLFTFTPAIEYAWSNRPYELWLFLLIASMYCWQRAAVSRKWSVALLLAATAMTCDYMFGIACLLPLMLAELIRSRRLRHWNPLNWIALVAPIAAVALYLHQITTFATNSFSPLFLHPFRTLGSLYADLLPVPLLSLVGCAIAVVLLVLLAGKKPVPSHRPWSPPENVALGASLLALPILLAVASLIRHTQFFPRYGLCAAPGLAILGAIALVRFTRHPKLAAALFAIALPIAGLVNILTATYDPYPPTRALSPGVAPIKLETFRPDLPIAFAGPLSYTELNASASPALLHRAFYVYNREQAERFTHSTVFEDESTTARLLHYQSNTAPLPAFLAAHPTFLMAADTSMPEEWLPSFLTAAHAQVTYLGKFDSSVEDNDLYLVTLTH